MGKELASIHGEELALGCGNPSAAIYDHSLAANRPGFGCDRPDEIDLGLETRVPLTDREGGVDRAAQGRIEDRHRKPPVHDADRVVEIFARLAPKNCLA